MNTRYLLILLAFTACTTAEPQPDPWAPYPMLDAMESLAKLPKSLPESSGLLYSQGELWSVNDGGNSASLYEVGIEKKKKKRQLKVKKVDNKDWEALAQDSSYFYIGDFGNNDGNRQDLAIHQIAREQIQEEEEKVKVAGTIAFAYPGQDMENWKDWLPKEKHNYDCEAMIATADSLYLFSKNHADQNCHIYRLPKTPGQYQALPVGTLNTTGLITGATWVEDRRCLVLIGYNRSFPGHQPFIWMYWDFPGHQFWAGKKQRLNLPEKIQAEAISYQSGSQFLLTAESSSSSKAQIFRVDLGKWLDREE